MDLKKKVTEALRRSLQPEHIQLEDDDGISGIVVSTCFQRMPALKRQTLIHDALSSSSVKFSKAELRRILAIAGLTTAEFEALDYKDGNGSRL